jgi:RecA/RadA recombinase
MSLRAKLRDISLDQFSIAPDQAESGENDVAPSSSSFEKESVAVAPLAASPANHDEEEKDPKKRFLFLPTVLTRNPKAVLSLDPQQLSSMLSSSVSSSTRHYNFQCAGPSPPRHEHDPPLESDVCTSNAASLLSYTDDNTNYNCIQKLRREIANTIALDEMVGHSNMQCSHVNSSSSSFVTGGFTLLQAIQQQEEQKEDLQDSPYPTTCSSPLKISTGSVCLDRLLTSQEDPKEDMEKRFFNFDATPFQNKKQKVRHGLPTGHGTGSKDDPDVLAGSVGIGWNKITQVSGPSSSGKTQLGLMLAVNMMILDHHHVIMRKNKDTNHHLNPKKDNVATTKRDYRVYYIASSCSGSVGGYGLVPLARRLRHLVTMLESKGEGNDLTCVTAIRLRQQILDGIVLDSARDGYELLARLLSFEQELHDRVKNIAMRVIDRVGMIK